MDWEQITGQKKLKTLLKNSIAADRVSHAQLFTGKAGYGVLPLVLAFAKEIFEKENLHSASKVERLNHLDLHFTYPVYTSKEKELSKFFADSFREMVLENPYSTADDWSALLESENKQLAIHTSEIEKILDRFLLKSYEGGSKILVVWQADKMNITAANKFLKFLEEPPEKTYIFLVVENAGDLLPTIYSRTQIVEVPAIADADIVAKLTSLQNVSEEKIKEITFRAQGNWHSALQLLHATENSDEFEQFFVQWMREAFQVKKKPELLKNIIYWARTIAAWNREKQKNFLQYCAEIFRLALLQNYASESLVYRQITSAGFNWAAFSSYIHGANIEAILEELSEADYHLQRNANPKIVWTDLGIKLTRYLHRKAVTA